MRPTASTMLQQNNNNNYPCLDVSGSTREMLQKCSRASLPFPGRLELGLGDLPLIRGLRAWALCSKNRRKAGSLLGGGGGGGGGRAPAAPPAARTPSTSCPRPADVYLSEEWGRMGYGLPLGLDARQAGIGALVTVATLKTSEGSGKTQTQCLFLRTEKGNCLYSTAKPGSGVVGGWLRGKTGGGGGGGKDNGPSPPAPTGANWARVRSGRRWRKSGHAASREKAGASRERRQRSGEHPAAESAVEERQEERDKEGLDGKAPPSPQQDSRRATCCHSASPRACSPCGRRVQDSETQDEQNRGESPRRGTSSQLDGDWKGMRKERRRNEEEEEEEGEGTLSQSQSYCSAEAVSSPDLQSNRTTTDSHMEESPGESQSDKEPQTSQKKDDHPDEDEETHPGRETFPTLTGDLTHGRWRLVTDDSKSAPNGRAGDERREDVAANVNGFFDYATATVELETEDFHEEKKSRIEDPAESRVSDGFESFPVFTSDCVCASESSVPPEGSTRPESCRGQEELESSQIYLNGHQQEDGHAGEDESESQEEISTADDTVKEQLSGNRKTPFFCEDEEISDCRWERDGLSSPVRHRDPSVSQTDSRIEAEKSSRRGTRESEKEERLFRNKGVEGDEAVGESEDADSGWREEEEEEEDGDTCGPASITLIEANGETGTNVAVDPPTLYSLPLDNPAPSLPPLEFMAVSLDCLEAEKEQEEEEIQATVGDEGGGQDGRRSELDEEGSTVAAEDGREEEEEEDEFGVFMQAEGEPDWSEGFTTSASVPCGSRGSIALGDEAVVEESPHWTAGWTDQSEDSWAAFPQDSSDSGGGGGAVEQWWPSSAAEDRRDRLSTNHSLAAIFTEAFPSLPAPSSSDPRDLNTVPTLTQLLRGRASQDQGLLDSFHDLNKMIGQRYKRASGVSRDLLLRTLHLEPPHSESRPAVWTASRRLSPGLPSANQHAQNAAAKRRLSYDYNRNIME